MLGRASSPSASTSTATAGRRARSAPAGDEPLGDFRFQQRAPATRPTRTRFGDAVKVTPVRRRPLQRHRDFGGVWGAQAGRPRLGRASARRTCAGPGPSTCPACGRPSSTRATAGATSGRTSSPSCMDHFEAGFAPHARLAGAPRPGALLRRRERRPALRPAAAAAAGFANTRRLPSARRRSCAGLGRADARPQPMAGAAFTRHDARRDPLHAGVDLLGRRRGRPCAARLSLDAQQVDERVAGNLRFPGPLCRCVAYFLLNGRLGVSARERAARRPRSSSRART